MRARSRLRMLAVALAVAVAGPWTTAHADDWPVPGDPWLDRGVILGDVSFPSVGAVGFRVELPTGGELDALGWLGASFGSGDMVAIGGYAWEANTNQPGMWFTHPHGTQGPDVSVYADGAPVFEFHQDRTQGAAEAGGGSSYLPGTYDVVIWAATNAPSATTRFRLHAPADATLLNETTSTSTFMRTAHDFTGTARASVMASQAIAAAELNVSTSVDITHAFFGEFGARGGFVGTPVTVPLATYSGPTGTHDTNGQVRFDDTPAGAYTFTLNADADANAGPTGPFVAGADIEEP